MAKDKLIVEVGIGGYYIAWQLAEDGDIGDSLGPNWKRTDKEIEVLIQSSLKDPTKYTARLEDAVIYRAVAPLIDNVNCSALAPTIVWDAKTHALKARALANKALKELHVRLGKVT